MSLLPGHFPAGAMMGGDEEAVMASLTLVDSTGALNDAVTLSEFIQAGDLIVLTEQVVNEGTIANATPSGFTQWMRYGNNVNVSGFYSLVSISYKIADGSEASTSVSALNGDDQELRTALVFRGNIPITSVTPSPAANTNPSGSGESTNGNPTAKTISSASGTLPLVALGFYSSAGTVSPRTMTPAKDGEEGSNEAGGGLWTAYKIYNSDASNVDISVDIDDEGNLNIIAGGYLSVA